MVCACVCMHTPASTDTYTHVPACTHLHPHPYTHVCRRAPVPAHSCVCTDTPPSDWGLLFGPRNILVCGSHGCQVLRQTPCKRVIQDLPRRLTACPPPVRRPLVPSSPNSFGTQDTSAPSALHPGAFRPTSEGAPAGKAPGSSPAQPSKWR